MNTINHSIKQLFTLSICAVIFALLGCSDPSIKEINIGFIGPLTTRATDLGIGPANAMQLAVEQYNSNRSSSQPKVNLFIEDDKWDGNQAVNLYDKLQKEHLVDVVFISNSDGTVAIQDKLIQDQVIAINPLNSDSMLSALNENTFKIAKSTEEANGLIGVRIVDSNLKKAAIIYFPNDFMTRGAKEVAHILKENDVAYTLIKTEIGDTNFVSVLKQCKEQNHDAYVFFGYKEFGYAMKQARDLGINAQFFGSTVLLDPAYYHNSEGSIVGTECSFFTPEDGNYLLAREFLKLYQKKFGEAPSSVWPPMQAYDAMNIVLAQVEKLNDTKPKDQPLSDWLREQLYSVKYHKGVCGNISISKNGSSHGIYFSLYRYESELKLAKIN